MVVWGCNAFIDNFRVSYTIETNTTMRKTFVTSSPHSQKINHQLCLRGCVERLGCFTVIPVYLFSQRLILNVYVLLYRVS